MTQMKSWPLGIVQLIIETGMELHAVTNIKELVLNLHGNLSSLITLGMGDNHLEGHISQEMCSLKNLTVMEVELNISLLCI
jgi:hypothetical protein